MTLQDLYQAVSQLGFEDSLGDDSAKRFLYATNRALIEVNSLRPRRKHVDVNHRVPKNLLFSEPKYIEKTETLTFTAQNAKSFYFEVCGTGSFKLGLKKKDGTIDYPVSAAKDFTSKSFISHKGIISYDDAQNFTGEAILLFEGDCAYTIRNIAMYDVVYSSNADDIIPYGSKVKYNISEMVRDPDTNVSDFEKFDTPPVDFNGNQLYEGYDIENTDIYLPIDRQGIYTINYLHKVEAIDMNADFSASNQTPINIDLEEDLAALLPNLIAAYVWLDDEADKSQYYYNLYLQRAEQIKKNTRNMNPVKFESVYGW